jgi:hypothetical protein
MTLVTDLTDDDIVTLRPGTHRLATTDDDATDADDDATDAGGSDDDASDADDDTTDS